LAGFGARGAVRETPGSQEARKPGRGVGFWLRFAPARGVVVLRWAGWDVDFAGTVHLIAFSCSGILGVMAVLLPWAGSGMGVAEKRRYKEAEGMAGVARSTRCACSGQAGQARSGRWGRQVAKAAGMARPLSVGARGVSPRSGEVAAMGGPRGAFIRRGNSSTISSVTTSSSTSTPPT
jgi:hypothetical protein